MQYKFPVFENLCPSWEAVTHLGLRRQYPKGSIIYDSLAPVNGIYFVKEGTVEIVLDTANGPEKVLYCVGRGCIFGEVSCFASGESGEASVRVRTASTLYFFRQETIKNTIAKEYPQLLFELIGALAHKLRLYGILWRDSLTRDYNVRVCRMLVYLVRFKGLDKAKERKRIVLRLGITQNDIARFLGIHRVTVTKAVNCLKELGIIRHFTKSMLDIADYPRLCQLGESEEGLE